MWTNLLKHYVHCLHWMYLLCLTIGDLRKIQAKDLPITSGWDESPTPQAAELFSVIWDKVYEELSLAALIERIVEWRSKVRRTELIFYLETLHFQCLDKIQEIYIERGLLGEEARSPQTNTSTRFSLTEHNFFELMSKAESEHKGFSDIMFFITSQMRNKRSLEYKFNLRSIPAGPAIRNKQLLLMDFPAMYVDQLDRLLWPEWYVACFSRNYQNSSMWANYADGHKGVCLIFETADADGKNTLELKRVTGWSGSATGKLKEHWSFVPVEFLNVKYAEKPGEIDFFNNIAMLPLDTAMSSWYTSEEGIVSKCAFHITSGIELDSWRKSHWDLYEQNTMGKSKDWEFEQECRLLLNSLLEPALDSRHRSLTYRFKSLKGIIFGIRTSDEDKVRIIEIIKRKCVKHNRTDFKLFQAYYSPEHGDIRKYEIPLRLANIN